MLKEPHKSKYCPHCHDIFWNYEDIKSVEEYGMCKYCYKEVKIHNPAK